jgi:hypothetical protein
MLNKYYTATVAKSADPKFKIYIGIDPGVNGGITMITEDLVRGETTISTYKMPCNSGELDVDVLRAILTHKAQFSLPMVVIEDVHAIFGTSAKSTFQFGYNTGVIIGVLTALNIPYTKVPPKKWQSEMWQGVPKVCKASKSKDIAKIPKEKTDTKAMSLIAAKRLFPSVSLTPSDSQRATKPHDGIVDSLLIAEYCRRNF